MRGLGSIRSRRAERVLIGLGLALLAVWGGAWIFRTISSRTAVKRFEMDQKQGAAINSTPAVSPAVGSRVNFTLWDPKRVQEYLSSANLAASKPLAVLRIPKIDLEVPVYNDTDDLTLNRGVGRIIGTAQMGGRGNLGIAGHRDGFFRGLKDLAVGDQIYIDRTGQTDTYAVANIEIVSPTDVSVLKATQLPSITLVTCYPFYYVGSAPQRYIVHANIETEARSDDQNLASPQLH
jgi:sortase A